MSLNFQIATTAPVFAGGIGLCGWQEFMLIYMLAASIAGAISLASKDPVAWRRGGVILLSIPLLFLAMRGFALL